MKKIFFISCIVAAMLSLFSCSDSEKNDVTETPDEELEALLTSAPPSDTRYALGEGALYFKDGDNEVAIGLSMPKNELTDMLPEMTAGEFDGFAMENWEFTLTYKDVTADDAAAYAKALVDAGFSVDALTEDMRPLGFEAVRFSGKNKDGYPVSMLLKDGEFMVIISEPKKD